MEKEQWIAQAASDRVDQMQDPELAINQAIDEYCRLGYSEEWIDHQIKTIGTRYGLNTGSNIDDVSNKEYILKAFAEEFVKQNSNSVEDRDDVVQDLQRKLDSFTLDFFEEMPQKRNK